jgi:hypothetical protein
LSEPRRENLEILDEEAKEEEESDEDLDRPNNNIIID